ncbi:thioredoxin family protein [Periweissella beninensis]|uniref:Thioredoxin family protein n=1 Tax=Periweissella beninensis TaxID=504936 RepID=A0ABT0VFZ9_9LACO|nr:thioredoxin family protein [Periweissella beninensis]MCM2436725.1 thioredoxin family protein [Periweissella beninensis]MCT4396371.1 thioredoxin [Periweissella beninensis]
MEKLPKMDQQELIDYIGKRKVMLFFSADWCPDCRFIKPVMPEIEAQNPDFVFVYVDRDENIDLCGALDVYGIPSFVAFDGAQEIGRFVNKDRKTQGQVQEFIDELVA